MTDTCFNDMLSLVKELAPNVNWLPKTLYESKQMINGLGLIYVKIDVCTKNYMLFDSENLMLRYYTVCGKYKYKEKTINRGKKNWFQKKY